jgi:hypothetical protein
MPPTSKRTRALEEVLEYHVRQKRARILYMVSELLDDLPSSDSQSDDESRADASNSSSSSSSPSSISSPSSPSSVSHNSVSSSSGTHSQHGPSDSEDLDGLEDKFFRQWDAQTQALAIEMLSARVLEGCPPVKKSGQLDLYLTDFRCDHPGRFRKNCVSRQPSSTASWNSSKTTTSSTTTPTSPSFLFPSNSPFSSFVSGTMAMHQRLNTSLSGLECLLGR